MRVLKISAIAFGVVAIIGLAVILGRFVFKLGPAQIGNSQTMSVTDMGVFSSNEYTNQVLDPAQMLPPSPVVGAPQSGQNIESKSGAALEADAAALASASCIIKVQKPIAIKNWGEKGSIVASTDGDDCANAIVRLEIKDSNDNSIFTLSAPSRDFGINEQSAAGELKAVLDATLPNSAIRAKAYPQWGENGEKPLGTEFDRQNYEKVRADDAPIICLKLPSAPQTCVAFDPSDGKIKTFSRG